MSSASLLHSLFEIHECHLARQLVLAHPSFAGLGQSNLPQLFQMDEVAEALCGNHQQLLAGAWTKPEMKMIYVHENKSLKMC